MAYRLPVFNLVANFWRFGNPTSGAPDAVAAANLAWGRRIFTGDLASDPLATALPFMTLLLPTGTNVISDVDTNGSPDTCEVPAGSGRYYLVHYVDYIGAGFANEHLGAIIVRIPGGGPVPAFGFILMESSGYVLLESGDRILLE